MKKLLTLFFALVLAFSANAQTIFSENFDDINTIQAVIIDNDGDGFNWQHYSNNADGILGFNNSAGFVASASYDNTYGALTPENWLVLDQVTINSACSLYFYVAPQDPNYYAESYSIYVSTLADPTLADFTLIAQETLTGFGWVQRTVPLNAYIGQSIYIAFVHENCTDKFRLNLDEITIGTTTPPAPPAVSIVDLWVALASDNGCTTGASSITVPYGSDYISYAYVENAADFSNANYSGPMYFNYSIDGVFISQPVMNFTGQDVLNVGDGFCITNPVLSAADIAYLVSQGYISWNTPCTVCVDLNLMNNVYDSSPDDNSSCHYITFAGPSQTTNYTVTATAGAGGSITPSGSQTYSAGASPSFTITPNTCYSIADVQVDGISIGAVPSYSFPNISANHTISASFVAATYTVAVSVGPNGTVSYNNTTLPAGTVTSVTVNCGDTPTFTFHPDNGYAVTDVAAGGTSMGAMNSYTFPAISGNTGLSVTFGSSSTQHYTITATAGNGGAISPNGATTCAQGTAQNYTITPADCYEIADVLVDGVSQGAVGSYAFTNIQGNHTIEASFTQATYTITVTVGANGTVSYNGGTIAAGATETLTLDCGDDAAFTFHPNGGYEIVSVIVNGENLGGISSYQFADLHNNGTLNITFGLEGQGGNEGGEGGGEGEGGEGDPTTGINDVVVTSFSIFPNPANDVLNVSTFGYDKVEISNFLGQTLYTASITENRFAINVAQLSAGVYFIKVSGENGINTQKFIKE